jgi:hypothetical protein
VQAVGVRDASRDALLYDASHSADDEFRTGGERERKRETRGSHEGNALAFDAEARGISENEKSQSQQVPAKSEARVKLAVAPISPGALK